MLTQPSSSRRELKSKHYKFLPKAYCVFFYDWRHYVFKPVSTTSSEGPTLQATFTTFEMEESHLTVEN